MLSDGAQSTRAAWRASRTEALCTRGARFVTGADLVRVARAPAPEPWHATQTAPAAADDPTGIVTDGGRRRVNPGPADGPRGCLLPRTSGGLGREAPARAGREGTADLAAYRRDPERNREARAEHRRPARKGNAAVRKDGGERAPRDLHGFLPGAERTGR
ncbi:hypothetical protein [Streptomyces prasinosporus]|uniref:hypothetical protein n=1 Tax=Streptomyces prasinosporus TaxID=68256 RepID=UPI0031E6CB15